VSDFILIQQQTVALSQVQFGQQTYSLDEAAVHADVHPDLIRYYCRSGLLGEDRVLLESQPVFDDQALYDLRMVEHYRRHHGVNFRALPLVCRLLREIEGLHAELRFLRSS
jgi:DNA-binding transcriptional MerR regulator